MTLLIKLSSLLLLLAQASTSSYTPASPYGVDDPAVLGCDQCGTQKALYIGDSPDSPTLGTSCPKSIIEISVKNLDNAEILRTLTTSVPDDTGSSRFLHHYSSVKKGASFSLFSPGSEIQFSYGQSYLAIPTPISTTTESSSRSSCTPACRGSSGGFQALASSSCCSPSYCHCSTSPVLLSCPFDQVFCPKQGLCVPATACPPSCCAAEREEATGLKVTYTCRQQKELEGDEDQLDYGSGEVTKALQTNNAFTYTLQPTVLRHVDVQLNLPSPISGFVAVDLGNGSHLISSRSLALTIFNPDTTVETSTVQVVTFNTAMEDKSNLTIKYGLEEPTSPPPSTTTTTQRPVYQNQFLTIFILIVDEANFYDNSFNSFQADILVIISGACSDTSSNSSWLHFDPLVSCRTSCGMTSNPARGCVKVGVHLEDVPATCLPAASRVDFLREQLEETAGQLEERYSAGRVTANSCTDITWKSEWVWVAVGLVASFVLISLLILLLRGRFRGVPSSPPEDQAPIVEKEEAVARGWNSGNFEVINGYEETFND